MDAILKHSTIVLNDSLTLQTRALRMCITENMPEEDAIAIVNDEQLLEDIIAPYLN